MQSLAHGAEAVRALLVDTAKTRYDSGPIPNEVDNFVSDLAASGADDQEFTWTLPILHDAAIRMGQDPQTVCEHRGNRRVRPTSDADLSMETRTEAP